MNHPSAQCDQPGLPPCASRRDFDPEQGLYFCAHPQVHAANQLVTSAICGLCSRWRDEPPRQFRPFPTKPFVRRDGPCMYLGRQVGLRECPTCRGQVQLKVFDCGHPQHDTTTLPDCSSCFDYERRLDDGSVKD